MVLDACNNVIVTKGRAKRLKSIKAKAQINGRLSSGCAGDQRRFHLALEEPFH